ncbi:piezo-type mechanosensitive ion channel component 2-like isoform X2 [Ornithodoros turicata]|uniref:piezo-type mechanosensitive ion channel component 2-like isoform X2 n=1 Tax=Ornithodoros turicata TaxID=34597 RepID=UPI003139DE7A
MVKAAVSLILFRVGIPIVLLLGVLFRYNAFSLLYFMLLLANPHLPSPGACTSSRHSRSSRGYLRIVVLVSAAVCLCQLIYQVVLLSTHGYGDQKVDPCSSRERVLALIGLHRADEGFSFPQGLRLIGIDGLILVIALITMLMTSKLVFEEVPSPGGRGRVFLLFIGELMTLVLMAAAGVLYASLLSLAYFLCFLALATWLSLRGEHHHFYLGRCLLLVYSFLHLLLLYGYQFDFAQDLLRPELLTARLLGLPPLRESVCEAGGASENDVRSLRFRPLHWTLYMGPLSILAFYWMLAIVTHYRLRVPVVAGEKRPRSSTGSMVGSTSGGGWGSEAVAAASRRASMTQPPSALSYTRRRRRDSGLLQHDHVGRSYQAMGQSKDDQAPKSPWNSPDGAPLPHLGDGDHGAQACQPNVGFGMREALLVLLQVVHLLTRGSYVVTLIIMMAWSITYHSWLTFILLFWSCIVWMMPSSRAACLRSSPALVAYAEALLLLQYLYSLDLRDDELPQKVHAVNLAQIGLVKYHHDSYQPLAVKILYSVMFWITLRQYVEYKRSADCTPQVVAIETELAHPQETASPEIVAMEPFAARYHPGVHASRQMSVTVAAVVGAQASLRRLGALLHRFLTHYWIWVVASMLMVISLGGSDVVLYRIAYMFLFLFFILMFQFSYELWIRVMYGFWLTVIIYSMLVLVLIYTYQFENFPSYWTNYLGVPQEIQKDIGLEVYQSDPGTLFLKLLTPTFFLVITIIQLHYFHQEFVKLNQHIYSSRRSTEDVSSRGTYLDAPEDRVADEGSVHVDLPDTEQQQQQQQQTDDEEEEEAPTPETVLSRPPSRVQEEAAQESHIWWSMERIGQFMSSVLEVVWRLLEIHMIKIVLFSVMCLSIYDVCAVHVVFVALVVVALPLRGLQTFLCHCCSLWASALLLAKMIYQLGFVDTYGWETNCTHVQGLGNATKFPFPFNQTIDNRVWVGFEKTSHLTSYCKGYIGLIVVFSAYAIVRYRQRFHRLKLGLPEPSPGVVFPLANRGNADQGLGECLQFLVNYFFYKFGVEVCFVTMVACIGVRLDVFSLVTALWLCALFLLRRQHLSCAWPFYVTYLCIVLPLQYLMAMGLPPGLCIEYPWWEPSNKVLTETAIWLYLPNFENPPTAAKILVDFFQLVFACCQLYVFALEKGGNSGGGSNEEIYNGRGHFTGESPNPIPDFTSYNKTYLSNMQVLLFFSFYWVTLAVMFLAGTNRVSLFAMGYVLGCFFFLWNGNEFYLKPMQRLLRMWNTLLAYNVVVILIKCILQVVGCVFLDYLECWMVQLLGIACLKKLEQRSAFASTPTEYSMLCCIQRINMCRWKDFNGCPQAHTVGKSATDPEKCGAPMDEAGLLWDGICLAFLLVQKRIFMSYYFQHLIIEVLAQQSLASRGAEMIHEIQCKEVQHQRAVERDIMEKIKCKMDKIRATQQKMRTGGSAEPETHYQAIRSGDYYLFEDSPGADTLDLDLDVKGHSPSDEDADVKVRGLNALLSNAIKAGTVRRATEDQHGAEDDTEDVGESSCLSPIVSADRSLSRTVSGASQPSKSSGHQETEMPSTSVLVSPDDQDAEGTVTEGITEQSPPLEEGFMDKVRGYLTFALALMDSLLISATAKLNSVSRDYRYVAKRLAREKRGVKGQFANGLVGDLEEALVRSKAMQGSQPLEIDHVTNSGTKSCDELLLTDSGNGADGGREDDFAQERPSAVRFLAACYYALVSRSEVVCYLVIVVNQMKSASLLSLPLPLMAFLWGSLSVPRPTKLFWVTIITYTEAIVVIKYLFQFDLFGWNKEDARSGPFDPPRLLGIERRTDDSDYALYDLLLLLMVFFHRFMLKSLGLWKDTQRSVTGQEEDTSADKADVKPSNDKQVVTDEKPVEGMPATIAAAESGLELAGLGTLPVQDCDYSGDDTGDADQVREQSTVGESFMYLSKIFEGINRYLEPFRNFFDNLLHPVYRVTTDVYAYMFFCDFINFFIMVFGYWAFGTGGSEDGVASYFKRNEVPIPFLIMLLAQFALIVIDRALYLRKYILGKLVFQIFMVLVIHIWMFFVLPAISHRGFVEDKNLPPKLWYFIKCIYLILSAYQIRSGYPTRILGNFFCKKYNYINYFLFKGYMLVPFLYELRSLMDWIWTDTSMNLSNWLKMEDIFANVFLLKCLRRAEEEYPTPRGSCRSSLTKYGLGGLLLFAIILIIWFPLLLFSLGNTVGRSLLPSDVTLELNIGGYQPLFRINVQQGAIKPLPYDSWRLLQAQYKNSAGALAFLANYDAADVAVISINGNSTAVWSISPPSQEALIRELNQTSVALHLRWQFTRDIEDVKEFERTHGDEKVVTLADSALRRDLAMMLSGDAEVGGVTVPPILPKYLLVSRAGRVDVVRALDGEMYRNLTLRLHTGSFQNLSGLSEWWQVQGSCSENYPYPFLPDTDPSYCSYLNIIVFCDKVFPQALSLLSGYGIVGLYTTFVLVASRLMRGFMAGTSFTIMFDDMPYVDRVLQLCLDIYLVRESRELALEEDLFAKLIFLYRSPETLIKWTRPTHPQPRIQ